MVGISYREHSKEIIIMRKLASITIPSNVNVSIPLTVTLMLRLLIEVLKSPLHPRVRKNPPSLKAQGKMGN
jgi:hypothetical protein